MFLTDPFQFCRCAPRNCVVRITIRTVHACEESLSFVAGIRALSLGSSFTRLLATCVASRLVPASFVVIRDSIAGLGCASGENLDCLISVCSIMLSEYTRTLFHWALVGTIEIHVEGQ